MQDYTKFHKYSFGSAPVSSVPPPSTPHVIIFPFSMSTYGGVSYLGSALLDHLFTITYQPIQQRRSLYGYDAAWLNSDSTDLSASNHRYNYFRSSWMNFIRSFFTSMFTNLQQNWYTFANRKVRNNNNSRLSNLIAEDSVSEDDSAGI